MKITQKACEIIWQTNVIMVIRNRVMSDSIKSGYRVSDSLYVPEEVTQSNVG